MNLLFRWLMLILAVIASAYFVERIEVVGILAAVIAGAVLVLIHTIIKPVIKILTLPINILTLGIFSLVLNGLFFWFVSTVVPGFEVSDFMSALWGSVIVSVLNWLADKVIDKD
ncbi:MAG: putative rane protein [Patescibacteria group bacterium]|nr:putative rane protein [Patescibacteria group bacterium]